MYSGFLGIAPIKQNVANQAANFLEQLQTQGLIDHLVVSFYVNADCSAEEYCSHIKFGSYDRSSMLDGHELELLSTANWATWDLNINKLTIGSRIKPLGAGTASVRISPELPYLYFPDSLYDHFLATINSLYSDHGTICDKKTNRCKFNRNCILV